MNYSVSIIDKSGTTAWSKALGKEEFDQVEAAYEVKRGWEERSPIGQLFFGVVTPLRIDSAKHFTKDFFLPTAVNYGAKVKTIAGRFFAIFLGVILDLPTLPLRLLTALPRAIANSRRKEDPLLSYFKSQHVPEKFLRSNFPRIELRWQKRSEWPTGSYTTEAGERVNTYGTTNHLKRRNVFFADIPNRDSNRQSSYIS